MTIPRRCTATTKAGRPCRAYAIADTDPPTCSAHLGRGGAPAGNQNARQHGFYTSAITNDELADLIRFTGELTLNDEIALCRVTVRRLAETLATSDPQQPREDYARLAALMFAGTRTVARLLRDQRALSGEAADGIAAAIAQALDELGTEWGLPL